MSTKVIYTAKTHATGGRDGSACSLDGRLDAKLARPGGPGDGTNPEQLFAVGYAACFEGALGVVGRRAKAEVGDVGIDSKVSLTPNAQGGFDLGVQLDVSLPSVTDIETAKQLVHAAHQVCPYSNATRGNIAVDLTVNGQRVD